MIYNKTQLQQAHNTDTVEFLTQRLGITFKKTGSYYKSIEHDSLCVNKDRKKWYWNSRNLYGGDAIDYLMRVEKRKFNESVGILLNGYEEFSVDDEL